MNRFNKLPQFKKEFLKLSKKHPSLSGDLKNIEKLIALNPTGIGVNFATIYHSNKVEIVKARLACRSLINKSIRLVYAYHQGSFVCTHIEIYLKGDKKDNEVRKRIEKYIQNH